MRKNKIRSFFAIILATSIISQPITNISFKNVIAETIENHYNAKENAVNIIQNANFTDVSSSHWAKETVSRLTALNIIKGYGRTFNPKGTVSNEEVLAFIIRAVATEEEAQQAAIELDGQNRGNAAKNLWSRGYLKIANDLGLITQDEFNSAIGEGVSEASFSRTASPTREQVAEWLVKALNSKRPELITPIYSQQAIWNFKDARSISTDKAPYVEAAVINKIMIGDNGNFRPKDKINRAEIAQTLYNVDEILYQTKGLLRKQGIVEKIEDSNVLGADKQATRKYYIRNNEGGLDVINYEYNINQINQVATKDVPTYNNGKVEGLFALKKDNSIEYIVDDINKIAQYVSIKGKSQEEKVQGILQPLTELGKGNITIMNTDKSKFTYKLSKELYIPEESKLRIGNTFYTIDKLPVGNNMVLTLANNLVTNIDFYAPNNSNEINGIVKEINKNFGYITIADLNSNADITKQFNKNNIQVKKQNYYDKDDEMGYIDQVFDVDLYDDRNTTIDNIEIGDIVYLRLSNDGEYVTHISAKTNYFVKYGEVKKINHYGNKYNIIIEFEDGQIANYEVPGDVPVRKNGVGVASSAIQPGDWVKLLVNQGILGSGLIKETIKQIQIDSYNNTVTTIYKGQLGKYDRAQKTITLQNGYSLGKIGWDEYKQSRKLSIGNKGVDTYYNGKKVSLDEAMALYNGDGYTVFVAMERDYDNEKVCKVSITSSRDSLIGFDTVTSANGYNNFTLFNNINPITANAGTIVVRNGRLVTPENILAPDYAQVVLGGASTAAVVNITNESKNAALTISRGRIKDIADNTNFTVSSQGMLKGVEWIFSPIERTYTVDYTTLIKDADGIINLKDFKTYGQNTQYEEVFNIISEGTKAKYLIKGPYCKEAVNGVVYDKTAQRISIKDTVVYNSRTKQWDTLSIKNSYAEITIDPTTIILKNDKMITADQLVAGDKIKILTVENLADKLKLESSREITGYIILVE